TPPSIRRLLTRCLEKDRRKRLPDIGVARLEIDDALAGGVAAVETPATRPALLPWLIAAAAVLALAASVVFGVRTRSQPHWVGTRLSESTVAIGPRVSPDGKLVAFLAMVDGELQ